MRVLHLVSSPTLTGPADPALSLASAQRSLGIDAAIAFDHYRPGNMTEKAQKAGVPVQPGFTLSTIAPPWTALKDFAVLRPLASKFEVVHAHASHDHAIASLLNSRTLKVRSIHHPRSCERRGLQSIAYRRTAGFIFVAEAHRQRFLENYPGIDVSRTEVVSGAVDTERFRPGLNGAAFRLRMGVPSDAFVLGMIARIKPGRRHDVALQALQMAQKSAEGTKIHLVLIGKGEGESSVRNLVESLALGASVSFYGFRDEDLPEAIASCDATVLLAEGNDASCRAVLESLAVGVPVIGARVPAIEAYLRDQVCGLLVDADDPASLAQAMIRWASSPLMERSVRSTKARALILERYDAGRRASLVLDFYARLAAVANPAVPA